MKDMGDPAELIIGIVGLEIVLIFKGQGLAEPIVQVGVLDNMAVQASGRFFNADRPSIDGGIIVQ